MWTKVRAIAAEEAAKAYTSTVGTKDERAPHGWKQEIATLRSDLERLSAEVAALKSGKAEASASPDRTRKP